MNKKKLKSRMIKRRIPWRVKLQLSDINKNCDNCKPFINFHESKIPIEISVTNYNVRCRYCSRYLGTYMELVAALERDHHEV